ncbi:MAG: B12-binding domain-containing radical SAM protein, partial [bacterium]
MKVMISYPPLPKAKGHPMIAQNRQFQFFSNPTNIYPVIPASAATLLQENGFEVIWNDAIAEQWRYHQFINFFAAEKPGLVAIETKTPVVKQHWQIIDELKALRPQTTVVLMGDHVTALPEESMRECPVDFVITGGDYDFSLLALCEWLEGKASRKLPPGVWYREDGEIRNKGPFRLDGDLNELPFIDRGLTKWWLYSEKNGNYKRTPGTYIMAGRDCWHHRCTFCSWTTIFPSYRVRWPEKVLDEVGSLIEEYGVREIMDDTGTFPVGEWLREFCRGMIERGYNQRVTLDCNMRFGALSSQDYELMKEAGFRLLLFGLESANQETLDRINKRLTVEEIVESCRMARTAGLYPHVTIMFGYPWETYQDALNTLNLGRQLLKKGWAYTVQATVVIP